MEKVALYEEKKCRIVCEDSEIVIHHDFGLLHIQEWKGNQEEDVLCLTLEEAKIFQKGINQVIDAFLNNRKAHDKG